jgi:septum formation protein
MSASPLPTHTPLQRKVILGSTSRYRKELLSRLRVPFDTAGPDVDETPLPGEAPATLARRLALAKAREVSRRFPEAVVIGSDQVADLGGEALGKPGTHDRAVAQLRRMRGQTVVFQTAVAVVCAATGFEQLDLASMTRKSNAIFGRKSRTTAPAAPRAKDWASPCCPGSTTTIPAPWSVCR